MVLFLGPVAIAGCTASGSPTSAVPSGSSGSADGNGGASSSALASRSGPEATDVPVGTTPSSSPAASSLDTAASKPQSHTDPSGASKGRKLRSTGILLAGSPTQGLPSAEDIGYEELDGAPWNWQTVVDGAGHAWVRGPWVLSRVDLDSGRVQSWDGSDDKLFMNDDMLLATPTGSGVWLLVGIGRSVSMAGGTPRSFMSPRRS